MTINILDQYDRIAFDFDGTLIDHPAAEIMQEYILNTPEKNHTIVTFRSMGLLDRIWHDLDYYRIIDKINFDGLLSVDHELWEAFTMLQQTRKINPVFRREPLTKTELDYMEWKGMVCKKHNLQVLVDDNTEHTILGCKKYNIPLIHPDDFV